MKTNNIRREFKEVVKWLDSNKFLIYNKGIVFKLNATDAKNDDFYNVGMGSVEDMVGIMYEQMYDIFRLANSNGQTLESFAAEVASKFTAYAKWRDENVDTEGSYMVFPPEASDE